MKVTWVNPCFRDYRVPVYQQLDRLLENRLTVVFSRDRTPASVAGKLDDVLGKRAVGLRGEWRLDWGADDGGFANAGVRIPYQPGLLNAVGRSKPEVIVSEGFFQWTPASVFYKSVHRVPLVIAYERTAHTERNAGFFRTQYRRFVARKADAFACNGRLSKEYCTTHLRIEESRIVTGAMSADSLALARGVASISEQQRRSIASELRVTSPVYLYVGRLIRLKGLRELLSAWQQYASARSNPGTLLLVGEGAERPVLETMVREHRLKNVVLVGAVPYNDVKQFFAIADVLVMPTLEDNWSLVVPEAMACGLPILCSCYNGCWPELVHHNKNGWVFDPYHRQEFSSLLGVVHEGRADLAEMGNASRQIISEYSPETAARAVLRACQIALSSHQRTNRC